MKRLKRRQVVQGATIYEVGSGSTKIHTIDFVENSKGFLLISPMRVVDGKQETLTYLEKCGEVDPDLLIHTDDNDIGKYTLYGSQWWIVSSLDYPQHKFRKEIYFLMEQSFDKYYENGEDDKDLIQLDYDKKDKRIHRDFLIDEIKQF